MSRDVERDRADARLARKAAELARVEAGLCAAASSHGPATDGAVCAACARRRRFAAARAREDQLREIETLQAENARLRAEIAAISRVNACSVSGAPDDFLRRHGMVRENGTIRLIGLPDHTGLATIRRLGYVLDLVFDAELSIRAAYEDQRKRTEFAEAQRDQASFPEVTRG